MPNNDDLSIRERFKKDFGIDLPISGGDGSSKDNPVVIDPNYKDWSDVEYTFLKLVHLGMGKSWKLIEQSVFDYNGRVLDKMKLEVEGDPDNYYNYYFDVTKHMK